MLDEATYYWKQINLSLVVAAIKAVGFVCLELIVESAIADKLVLFDTILPTSVSANCALVKHKTTLCVREC